MNKYVNSNRIYCQKATAYKGLLSIYEEIGEKYRINLPAHPHLHSMMWSHKFSQLKTLDDISG